MAFSQTAANVFNNAIATGKPIAPPLVSPLVSTENVPPPKTPVKTPAKSVVVSSPSKAVSDVNSKMTAINNYSNQIANNQAVKKTAPPPPPTPPTPSPAPTPAAGTVSRDEAQAAWTSNGGNSTGWIQNADGTWTPPAGYKSPNATTTPTGTGSGQLDEYQSALADINDKATAASNTFQANITALQNGTFPMSPEESALLDSVTQSFQSQISAQTAANANYVGGVTEAGISSGASMYAPTIAMGQINGAVSSGIAKIADLNSKMTQAIITAKQSFEKQDFDELNAAYDDLQKSLDDRRTTLSDMWSAVKDVTDEQQKQQELDMTAKQNAFTDTLESDKFDWQEKMDTYDNYIKDQTLTLDQRREAETEKNDAADIAIKNATLGLEQRKEAFAEQQAEVGEPTVNADGSISIGGVKLGATVAYKDKANIPGVGKLSNGGLYFDPTQLANDTAKKDAQAIASAYGIKTLSEANINKVKTIDSAVTSLQQLKSSWDSLAPEGSPARGEFPAMVKQLFDTPAGQQLTAYGPNKDTLIATLKSAGITIKSLPDPGMFNATSKVSGDQIFNNVLQTLTNTSKSILGSGNYASYDQYEAMNPSPSYSGKLSGMSATQAIAKVRADHPDWSPDDVTQFLASQ
jgi:hypothetical protein